jgi:hypothetical protein
MNKVSSLFVSQKFVILWYRLSAHTHTHTHTHARARTHARAHTHTHTHVRGPKRTSVAFPTFLFLSCPMFVSLCLAFIRVPHVQCLYLYAQRLFGYPMSSVCIFMLSVYLGTPCPMFVSLCSAFIWVPHAQCFVSLCS